MFDVELFLKKIDVWRLAFNSFPKEDKYLAFGV